jgi:cytochrome oxidase Cu insertion factor (SCO1/SenC/PrrC family)
MDLRDTDATASARRSRRTLWLILAVCAAPIVASYAAYYFWQPSGHVNYGELIGPNPLPHASLTLTDGRPFRMSQLGGSWVMLAASPAACDDKCREKLVYMRQVRLAQGRESERVARVWLLTDRGTPDAALVAEHPGLVVVNGADAIVQALSAPRSALEHIYVVDPLGNLMMRFPENPDPRKMLKDLSRLLRHSKWK